MMITLEIEKELPEIQEQAQEIADKALKAVAEVLHCPYDLAAELMLVDDEEIRQINADTRQIDASTDVLSFPYCEYEIPGDFHTLYEDADSFSPETGELLLGDIVISVDHVAKQAEEYGHSLIREYAFLIVHSLLHLSGYDHMEEEEREIMEEKQREVMDVLGILR